MSRPIGVRIRFGTICRDGDWYAWTIIDDEPLLSAAFGTQEEAKRHNAEAADKLSARMKERGANVVFMNKGSSQES